MKAKGRTIHPTPMRPARWPTAWTIPCNTLISCLLTATMRVRVEPMYNRPEIIPPQATAPGKMRCGSRISSPMTDASSNPTKPKQITPKEFSTNLGLSGMRKSAELTVVPKRSQTTRPRPIRVTAAIPVPMPPRLLIHFPTPRPTMFKTTSTTSSAREALKANHFLSAKAW